MPGLFAATCLLASFANVPFECYPPTEKRDGTLSQISYHHGIGRTVMEGDQYRASSQIVILII
jgi:hypothetical protein